MGSGRHVDQLDALSLGSVERRAATAGLSLQRGEFCPHQRFAQRRDRAGLSQDRSAAVRNHGNYAGERTALPSDHARDGLVLLPGAGHWLKALHAGGWRQAVVTSAPRLNVAAVIDATHLDRLIDTIVCAEDVIKGKPHPEPFLLAADRLSVDPARCIVVEDAQIGLEGARRAGMKSIGVLTTHAALDANRVVKSLTELAEDAFDKLMSSTGMLRDDE